MRPLKLSTCRRALGPAAAALLAFALWIAPTAVMAESQSPAGDTVNQQPGRDPSLADLLGARHVVSLPPRPAGTTVTLHLSSGGWVDTSLGLLLLESGGGAQCPSPFQASQVAEVRCGTHLPATGMVTIENIPDNVGAVVAYSIDNESSAAACASLDRVATGALTPLEWERDEWLRGEPIAAIAHLSSADRLASVTGQSAYYSYLPARNELRPAGIAILDSSAASIAHAGSECATVQATSIAPSASGCPAPVGASLGMPPMSARGASQAGVTLLRGGADVFAAGSLLDESGWAALGSTPVYPFVREVMFPFAAGLLGDIQSELVVANTAVTATATVEIVMVDGNGQLHDVYTDPEPLCAGGARTYDIDTLAGELPSSGRGGPPMLSLRVSGLSVENEAPPSIVAAIHLQTSLGNLAYPGFADINPLAAVNRGDGFVGTPIVLLPDARVALGDAPTTSRLILSNVRAGGNAINVFADFYDREGNLVLEDVYWRVRSGSGSVFDLGAPMANLAGQRLTLPDGFHGSVILRSQNPRSPLAALLLNLPARDGRGEQGADVLDIHLGTMLLRGADPNAPTPTPTATRGASPTPTETETAEVTPTSAPPSDVIYLPNVLNRS